MNEQASYATNGLRKVSTTAAVLTLVAGRRNLTKTHPSGRINFPVEQLADGTMSDS